MTHKEDPHPGDDPKEDHEGDQHEVPDDGEDATPDDASDTEESEDDLDDSNGVTLTFDEIKRRAEERYGDLSPEEAEAQASYDLQETWRELGANLGPDLNVLSKMANAFTREIGESVTRRMMPQIRLVQPMNFSVGNPLGKTFKDIMRSSSLPGIKPTAAGSLHYDTRSAATAEVSPASDDQTCPSDVVANPAEEVIARMGITNEEFAPLERAFRENPHMFKATVVAAFVQQVAGTEQLRENQETQNDDIRTILDTMREQTKSVHETAQAMKLQLEQTKVQLEQMETAAATQSRQHDDTMGANHRSIVTSRWSIIVAAAALLASIVIGYFQLTQPVEVEWQGPPPSSTPAPSSEGATSPPQ